MTHTSQPTLSHNWHQDTPIWFKAEPKLHHIKHHATPIWTTIEPHPNQHWTTHMPRLAVGNTEPDWNCAHSLYTDMTPNWTTVPDVTPRSHTQSVTTLHQILRIVIIMSHYNWTTSALSTITRQPYTTQLNHIIIAEAQVAPTWTITEHTWWTNAEPHHMMPHQDEPRLNQHMNHIQSCHLHQSWIT